MPNRRRWGVDKMLAWSWECGSATVAVLAPLVAVPLAAITFYLRSLREYQVIRHAELVRRFELVESVASDLRKSVAAFERDYTTKEEWLRECMYARGRVERIADAVARLEARVGARERTAAGNGVGDAADQGDER
jgi:hypothetical protein